MPRGQLSDMVWVAQSSETDLLDSFVTFWFTDTSFSGGIG